MVLLPQLRHTVVFLFAFVVFIMTFSYVIISDFEASIPAQNGVRAWKTTRKQNEMPMHNKKYENAFETFDAVRDINEQNARTPGMYIHTVRPRVPSAEDKILNPVQPLPTSCGNENFLVVIVASDPDRFDRRSAIRQYWGKPFMQETAEGKNSVRVVFVLGRKSESWIQRTVEKEAFVHRDILLGNFQDHYRNLTLKTVVGLRWVFHSCKSVKYVLKTDDDVFVNVFKLMEWLGKSLRHNLYTGTCKGGSPVIRDPTRKWYVSYEEYPNKTYPTYCKGGGYLISVDALRDVVRMSYRRRRLPMEDVYVGLMARELGIVPVDDAKRFNLAFSKRRFKRATPCDLSQLFLAHPAEPATLAQMQKMVEKARKQC